MKCLMNAAALLHADASESDLVYRLDEMKCTATARKRAIRYAKKCS